MAYSDMSTQVTGYIVTASNYNQFVNNDKALYRATRYMYVEIYKSGLDVETGDGAFSFHVPPYMNGMNLTYVVAYHHTAGAGGDDTLIQLYNVTDTVDMLSTRLQIDSGEQGSWNASTSYVIDTTNDDLDTNDILRVDIDQLDSGTVPEGLLFGLGAEYP